MKRLLFNLYFFLLFATVLVSFYIYGLITTWPLELMHQHDRARRRWQKLAQRVLQIVFSLGGIKITIKGKEHLPTNRPVILCANHQSYFDGLIIFYATQLPFVAVTAPFASFPKLMTIWFPKLGFLEVARDTFEELKYHSALARDELLARAAETLAGGQSFLIFPEGRREFNHQLLPFHLGIAKIALKTKAPIVPIILKHVDELLPPNEVLISPRPISVEILPPINLHELSSDPIEDVAQLQKLIQSHLPASYSAQLQPPHQPEGKRAAFFDLDGTISRLELWQVIGKHYFKTHRDTKRLFALLHLLTHQHHLKHTQFFLKTLRLLRGLNPATLTEGITEIMNTHQDQIFYPLMRQLITQHRQEGNLVFILTEEPEPFVAPVFRFLGIPGFGTPIELRDGIITGNLDGHILKDEQKREKVLELAHEYGIDLTKSYAYGNSWHDYPMLRTVAHPFLVNPPKDLKRRAETFGAKIIHQN